MDCCVFLFTGQFRQYLTAQLGLWMRCAEGRHAECVDLQDAATVLGE